MRSTAGTEASPASVEGRGFYPQAPTLDFQSLRGLGLLSYLRGVKALSPTVTRVEDTNMSNIITVGKFTMDTATGAVEGPAEFMADPTGYAVIKEKLEAGTSVVFNYGCVGRDPHSVALVAIQTHYAAWIGQREFAARAAIARESQEKFVAEMRAGKSAQKTRR